MIYVLCKNNYDNSVVMNILLDSVLLPGFVIFYSISVMYQIVVCILMCYFSNIHLLPFFANKCLLNIDFF